MFYVKKHHIEYWQKWDVSQVLNPALNRRFIILALPMVVQYAMQVCVQLKTQSMTWDPDSIRPSIGLVAAQNWAWGILQGIMSSKCEILATAYGV